MKTVDPEAVAEFMKTEKNQSFVQRWFKENISMSTFNQWLEQDPQLNNTRNKRKRRHSVNPSLKSNYSINMKCSSFRTKMFSSLLAGNRDVPAPSKANTITHLEKLQDGETFMELVRNISNELNVDTLCHKILINVSILTDSDRGSLFLMRGIDENRYLVSKLFNVTEDSTLRDSLHNESNQICIPLGKGIAGLVARTKETINIKDVYKDPRFNPEIDAKTGYRTKSILCKPILNYDGEVVGVAQIMNKKGDREFTSTDEDIFENYLTFCGIGLTNAQLVEMSVGKYKRNGLLLNLAKGLFIEQQNMDRLIEKIMKDAQEMLQGERCKIYLVEEPEDLEGSNFNFAQNVTFSKIFQLSKYKDGFTFESMNENESCKTMHIAEKVVASGKSWNIPDTTTLTEKEFSDGITDHDNFKVNGMLTLPISDHKGKQIGSVQLINQINGNPFNSSDIDILESFAIFCGLGIHNCQMYENTHVMTIKQAITMEVWSYQASATVEETENLMTLPLPNPVNIKLFEYDFPYFDESELGLCASTTQMFISSGIQSRFNIPFKVLSRWVLSVRKNYRPVIYHNWRHGFHVGQCMYTMLFTSNMKRFFSDLQCFSLLVACLSHDLDHRGTNNAFQVKTESLIAQLYSTSTMEYHHFDQCVMIISSEGNNIFQNLSSREYHEAFKVIKSAIIATDLVNYFKNKGTFAENVAVGEINWMNPSKNELLRSMMMTGSDLAAITKPFHMQREIAELVSEEFFQQGDMERDLLNEEPIAMMDRKKKKVPTATLR